MELVDLCVELPVPGNGQYYNGDGAIVLNSTGLKKLSALQDLYDNKIQWLMKVLAQLDGNTSGFCRPLFERLNYNRYY